MDRFSEPPIRREKPEPDAIDAYKQRRDMELEQKYEEARDKHGQKDSGVYGGTGE
jgi:hypothetical protein